MKIFKFLKIKKNNHNILYSLLKVTFILSNIKSSFKFPYLSYKYLFTISLFKSGFKVGPDNIFDW